jgi:hypothetical protein
MTKEVPHLPHFARFPAVSSPVVKALLQFGQAKRIAMINPLL